ncbi:hypothetical protein O181_039148 [Austropuccinia psidii MF-1]|uniref:Piwi domain-containing protein n=1 Tax=Austropuccinia psidii MF-1 TaxID=1389203 RepID=A0A9Q3HBP6_9BASI|nr:hypothetical protein [Austropuccinia psidii MF-1]
MSEKLMTRPGYGAAGIKINVVVNAYQLKIPSFVVHHYDLAIQGQVNKHGVSGDVPPALGQEIFNHLKTVTNAFGPVPVVHDGRKNLFSPRAFSWPDNKNSFQVDLSTPDEAQAKRFRRFTVVITKVNEVKLDNLVKYVNKQVGSTPDEGVLIAITALNVVCNHDMSISHPHSKNKFFPRTPQPPPHQFQTDSILKLRSGIDIWRGYFSSVRMAPQGLILNFDLTSQPMLRSGNLLEVACDILGSPHNPAVIKTMSASQRVVLSRLLKMLKVSVRRLDRTHLKAKIRDLGGPANQFFFEGSVSPNSEQKKRWNVAAYIESTYQMKLRHPDLPVVKLTSTSWYPIELCNVEPGQKFSRKLSPDQLSEAIRWLTVKPQDRTRMLTQGVAAHLARSPTIGQWGIKLDQKPMTIRARRLPPPIVSYKVLRGPNPVIESTKVDHGSWNMVSKMLVRPVIIKNWVTVAFSSNGRFGSFDEAQAKRATQMLYEAMLASGISCAPPASSTYFATSRDSPVNESDSSISVGDWIKSKTQATPQLVICFLKEKNAWQYKQLKLFGDSSYTTATQCLAIDKVMTKGSPQYYANVVLKINVKMGGVNQAVGPKGQLFPTRTMVMGADVTHPGFDSAEPSIAALTGSTNHMGAGYAAEFSVQPGRQEIISQLHLMAKELLIKFAQRNNKALPDRLIFYRDGVSEGQFSQVLSKEVPLVRRAIQEVNQLPQLKGRTVNVRLTYIICGKRHHFKFGPTLEGQKRDADRSGNLLPGVIVDSDITHPFDFDWYGLSHAGLLGTSRASHYTVLVDDNNFKPDEIQTITYHLCYTYSRATRAVSIATPAYYAHHVCTRIKKLLLPDEGPEATNSNDTHNEETLRAYQAKAADIRAVFRNNYEKNGNFPIMEYWM